VATRPLFLVCNVFKHGIYKILHVVKDVLQRVPNNLDNALVGAATFS
jgi:hypothetical protein